MILRGRENWKGTSRSWASTMCQVLSEVFSICSLHLLTTLQEMLRSHFCRCINWTSERWRHLPRLNGLETGEPGFKLSNCKPLCLFTTLLITTVWSIRTRSESGGGELYLVVLPLLIRRRVRYSVTWVARGWGFRKRACWWQVLNSPAHISGARLKASLIQPRKVNPSQ